MAIAKCCREWLRTVAAQFDLKRIFIDPSDSFVFNQFCPECSEAITEEGVKEWEGKNLAEISLDP